MNIIIPFCDFILSRQTEIYKYDENMLNNLHKILNNIVNIYRIDRFNKVIQLGQEFAEEDIAKINMKLTNLINLFKTYSNIIKTIDDTKFTLNVTHTLINTFYNLTMIILLNVKCERTEVLYVNQAHTCLVFYLS
jgi:predicted P-loop ATPase/GTPase